jgi:heme/copper-type cytochrome/quinol oxidase subunit 2
MDFAAMMAVIMGSIVCFGAIFLVIMFVAIVIHWRIYEKAGQQGWAAMVPIYSTLILMDIIRRPRSWAWIILGLGLLTSILNALQPSTQGQNQQDPNMIISVLQIVASVLQIVAGLTSLYFTVRTMRDLARAFGHGRGFTAGLIFLPYIFYPILAFGDSQYQYTNHTALPGQSDLTIAQ